MAVYICYNEYRSIKREVNMTTLRETIDTIHEAFVKIEEMYQEEKSKSVVHLGTIRAYKIAEAEARKGLKDTIAMSR
jgi:Holliday junction resolvasome RuvABC endonuclease subunit